MFMRTTAQLGRRFCFYLARARRRFVLTFALSALGVAINASFALAAAPVVTGYAVNSTSASTVAVSGQVNPGGESTADHVAYGLQSSEWCSSHGAEGSPEASTTPVTLGFSDNSLHSVELEVGGLTPGTTYCFELIAKNSTGAAGGGQFQLTAGAPSAETFEVVATGPTTDSVQARVDPAGQSTTYHAAYAKATTEWCTTHGAVGSPESSTASESLAFTDSTYHGVTVGLPGLTQKVGYCVEVVAENTSAQGHGGFPIPFVAGDPALRFGDEPHATGAGTEVLAGQVDPAAQTTHYEVEYGLTSSAWCTSEGAESSPEHVSGVETLGFTDGAFHQAPATLTGLNAGSEYCARFAAENESGSVHDQFIVYRFVAGLPSGERAPNFAFATGPTTAIVEGEIDPAGQTTHYQVNYALASSTWCQSGEGSPEHHTALETLAFTDGAYHYVAIQVTGLTPGAEYCVELSISNPSGSAVNSEAHPLVGSFTGGAPSAITTSAQGTGSDAASVEGEVNPAAQVTHYRIEYGLAGSQWCTHFGYEGSPEHSTSLESLGATDSSFHKVTIELGGLTGGASYCARLSAENGSGSSNGETQSFTAGAAARPAVTKVSPSSGAAAGGTAVTISGTNLADATAVKFGGSSATIRTNTTTQITVESPAHAAGQVDVTVTTAVGTSAASEADRFIYEASSPPPPTHTLSVVVAGSGAGSVTASGISCPGTCTASYPAGTEVTLAASAGTGSDFAGWAGASCSGSGSCTVTLSSDADVTATFNTHKNKPGPPIVGQRATIQVVSGTVTVHIKGAKAFAPLSEEESIPDGSEVETTNGRVRITAATPKGGTQTAEVYGGRFRIHQDKSGEVHFILTLPLTGCARVTLPKGSAAAFASRAKHHSGPTSRHLWVSEHGGSWGTNGRYVSTSVEGTTWLTLDECTRSEVKVTEGKVDVRDLVRRKTKTISAGSRYTALAKSRRHR